MLRAMMWDPQTLDRDFKTMMQDFVARFTNQTVSTADFQGVIENHMKPAMDLTGDGRMDWFFNEWPHGADVSTCRLEYSLRPEGKDARGSIALEGTLTQSGVAPSFRMPVPIFAERGGKTYRVCVVALQGNSSGECRASLTTRPKRVLLNFNHDVLTDKQEVRAVSAPL
jgi:hypothetical protein